MEESRGMRGVFCGLGGRSLCRSRGFGRRANDPAAKWGEVSCGLETGPRRAAKVSGGFRFGSWEVGRLEGRMGLLVLGGTCSCSQGSVSCY